MSRYAVISDIHGNRFAFDAVLARLATLEIDEVICLGDIVGLSVYMTPDQRGEDL